MSTAVETAQAQLDEARHAQNLADSRYHKANVELREQALQDALDAEVEAKQDARLTWVGIRDAYALQRDAVMDAMRQYVEAVEASAEMLPQLDAAHSRCMKLGVPVEAKPLIEQTISRDRDARKLFERFMATTNGGRW